MQPDPRAWWEWWYERNELFMPQGEKPTQFAYQAQNQVVPVTTYSQDEPNLNLGSGRIDLRPSRPMQNARRWSQRPANRRLYSCLVAGTLVQTAEGLRAVDHIRPGDLVLSQQPETGELTYKPVLQATIRPPGPVLAIETPDNVIRATGGHLFFVAGQGWVRARELTPAMKLYDVHGTTPIRNVTPEDENEQTYNLIVADFHTYFVGPERVLSYDVTPLRPTAITVPGVAHKQ